MKISYRKNFSNIFDKKLKIQHFKKFKVFKRQLAFFIPCEILFPEGHVVQKNF